MKRLMTFLMILAFAIAGFSQELKTEYYATSRAEGTAAAIVASAASFQGLTFSTPYAATSGIYYVALQFNGTTAKFRTYPFERSPFVAGTVGGTWGTKADITPGTSYTVDVGPIVITY